MKLKQINQLKEGRCKVIAEYNGIKKEFDGYYKGNYPAVFFTIPSKYKILGYSQE